MSGVARQLRKMFGRPAQTPVPVNAGQSPQSLVETLQRLYREGRFVEVIREVEQLSRSNPPIEGLRFLQGQAYECIARFEEALNSYSEELSRFPNHQAAKERQATLSQALAKPAAEKIAGAKRQWGTSLPRDTLLGLQRSLHNYSYRGVPLLKNPFDFAIYPLLIWNLKPRTIFEVGSKSGGSAVWMGDLLHSFGIDGHILSVDLLRVETVAHPKVTFLEGNGRSLGTVFDEGLLKRLPRPWLVIEDADHVYDTSIAVLRFFHPWLRAGEYIVVEDGINSDLAQDNTYSSGPHQALKEFLCSFSDEYEIDADYCDFFGFNMTWCTNGFLKKLDRNPRVTSIEKRLQSIEQAIEAGRTDEAFVEIDRLKSGPAAPQRVDYLRALCFLKANQPLGAIEALKEELHRFPDNAAAACLLRELLQEHPVQPQIPDPEFQEIFRVIQPYTMIGEARLYSLFTLAKQICTEDVPGNFAECGVAAGGSSALLSAVIARYSRRPRHLFCFDTFEGLPAPDTIDRHGGRHAAEIGWGAHTCAAPDRLLLEIVQKLNTAHIVVPIKGLFSDTLLANRSRMGELAFLHVDGDWYASVTDVLDNTFDQLSTGACVQVDDYGYWEGCKQAVLDFQRRRMLEMDLQPIDGIAVWFRKS